MPYLKNLVRTCLQTCLKNDRLWHIAREFPVRGVVAARKKVISERLATRFGANPTVRSGPFRGLLYPNLRSAGSALVPKLLGTYEAELHRTIHSFRQIAFSTILDVGCAEGYYAVGLARLFPATPIRAYDISKTARELCSAMARANRANHVAIFGNCDRRELLSLPSVGRNLIISDCEGYEKELFDSTVARHLSASYFLIELHDFKDWSISSTLSSLFAQTHEIELIPSVSDREKARCYVSPLLDACDQFEREVAFAENRPDFMQWLVARPRSTAGLPGQQREPAQVSRT